MSSVTKRHSLTCPGTAVYSLQYTGSIGFFSSASTVSSNGRLLSILRFLVRSTVDPHQLLNSIPWRTRLFDQFPIPSHSTCTLIRWRTYILLLDFLTKDLLITSAVGTTTALTHLIDKIFCCLQQLWRLWMTLYLYLIWQICSWSATLSALTPSTFVYSRHSSTK